MTMLSKFKSPALVLSFIAMTAPALAQTAGGNDGGGASDGTEGSGNMILLERTYNSPNERYALPIQDNTNSCTAWRSRTGNDAMIHVRCERTR